MKQSTVISISIRLYLESNLLDKKALRNTCVFAIGSVFYKKRGKPQKRQLIPNRVSIEERPAIVQTNTELGHWEADTVIGKGHDGVLLTLVERLSKYVLIVKLALQKGSRPG